MIDHPVHPVADLFPMLPEDELAELAEDIKLRGLLHPITLDANGLLLDGRNRLAACRLVGVEPRFEYYSGTDPDGYVFATNIARRHLTKGQRAMLAARWCLVSKQPQRSVAEQSGLTAGRVGQAATVLAHAPDLADSVVAGSASLDEAYATARRRKTDAESTAAQLEQLRAEAPDLADLVLDSTMSLAEARAAAHERAVARKRDIDSARRTAAVLAGEFQSNVATVVIGHRYGEPGLVTVDMLNRILEAVKLLEGCLEG